MAERTEIRETLFGLWMDLEDAETTVERQRIEDEIDAFMNEHSLGGEELEEIGEEFLSY